LDLIINEVDGIPDYRPIEIDTLAADDGDDSSFGVCITLEMAR
jgi:hypothetical protein